MSLEVVNMRLSDEAEIGYIDNEKGIAIAEGNGIKEIWFTKLKAKDFRKHRE